MYFFGELLIKCQKICHSADLWSIVSILKKLDNLLKQSSQKTISIVLDELLLLEEVAEIIIIDDGSMDRTAEIIDTYLNTT